MGPEPAVADVRRAVRGALAGAPPGALVLAACSGGADSLALAAALAFTAPRAGLRGGAVTVDHGLQTGSAAHAERVAATLRGLGLDPVDHRTVTVTGPGGPEAAARTARYTALTEAARAHGAWAILLGHTRDDQAETVLLGLARGSGARSLSGMSPATTTSGHPPNPESAGCAGRGDSESAERDENGDPAAEGGAGDSDPLGAGRAGDGDPAVGGGAEGSVGIRYLRPLLGLSRETTRRACAALGLVPWEDPHNDDPAYRRVRVRHRVLPVLESELGPGVAAALARTAGLLRDDADALDAWAEREAARAAHPEGGLDAKILAELPRAVRTRILRRAALAAGAPATDLTAGHVAAIDELLTSWHGQRGIDLPGALTARRHAGRIVFAHDT